MHNFDLRIRDAAGSGYHVEVTASPAGETPIVAPMPSPLEHPSVTTTVHKLRGFRVDPRAVNELGSALWDSLFQPTIATRYAESLGLAGDAGLRVRLRIDPVELQRLPWEFLRNPEAEQFLTLSRRTSLVRYVAQPQPVRPLHVAGPLRVLVLISAPIDQPALQIDKERQLIESALQSLVANGAVELVVETDGRSATLQARLREGIHVLHYIGHGTITRGQGHLVLEDDRGTSQFVGAAALEPLLGSTALRCIVLTACESAAILGDPFLGLAPALVRGGVPAVIAMQIPVPDESAVIFSREFYRSLAQRLPMDVCVTEGRLGIRTALRENRIDWGIPTLFTRSDDGVLFAASAVDSSTQKSADSEAERRARGQSGGVNISGSTVTMHRDVAGRDVIRTNVPPAPATPGFLRRVLRRLFGEKSA